LSFVSLTCGLPVKLLPLVFTRDRGFPVWCEHGVSISRGHPPTLPTSGTDVTGAAAPADLSLCKISNVPTVSVHLKRRAELKSAYGVVGQLVDQDVADDTVALLTQPQGRGIPASSGAEVYEFSCQRRQKAVRPVEAALPSSEGSGDSMRHSVGTSSVGVGGEVEESVTGSVPLPPGASSLSNCAMRSFAS
jgi:hypothetical protein